MVRPESSRRGQRPAAVAVVRARRQRGAVGTPEMMIDSVSEPSVSVSAEEIVSGIAVSSLPEASGTVSVGASATGFTVTSKRVGRRGAVSPP